LLKNFVEEIILLKTLLNTRDTVEEFNTRDTVEFGRGDNSISELLINDWISYLKFWSSERYKEIICLKFYLSKPRHTNRDIRKLTTTTGIRTQICIIKSVIITALSNLKSRSFQNHSKPRDTEPRDTKKLEPAKLSFLLEIRTVNRILRLLPTFARL
jgi:hypothetical protein